MEKMFVDLFAGTFFEASVWGNDRRLFFKIYTKRGEAKAALKRFIQGYTGASELRRCCIRQVDNIRLKSNTNEYPRYLKLRQK